MLFRVREVHRVDAESDVGRVLSGLAALGDLDQLDRCLVQRLGVSAEAAPVGIGFFGNDLTLFHEPLQDAGDVEALTPPLKSQGQVLKINEHRQGAIAVWHHGILAFATSAGERAGVIDMLIV